MNEELLTQLREILQKNGVEEEVIEKSFDELAGEPVKEEPVEEIVEEEHEEPVEDLVDEIFFVDLPTVQERQNIFSIHLRKKGQDPSKFPMGILGKKTEGFNGAEIEECIKEAMFAAYVQNPDEPKLEAAHIVEAIEKTVPLSTTMKEQITNLREWAKTRAKNASEEFAIDNRKGMPVLLTLPELELERSFDIKRTDNKK